ncbi:unnamed protein product (macronuclear) [Paramecium tetraurelia]|uniref:Uncharacterized protein n=1 Tax=Paramecium tetraurelia TaxID=5888 RepID=A0E287_PARTE|nr:uncharacterized protein GSPATT00022576001 [Paramecium tetraurelia]CAK89404.1 unnamed protein product [Paramecium tetraurelia]|eukprot:XP_001456801.1 hypothetical protein (macronuclear) [Paramecium tetraurelia strain d4-2]
MQITQDMFKWLKSLNVIQNGIPKQNGRMELDPETTSAFYNGFKMSELLDKLTGAYNQQVKIQTNPTARLYNWNIITERLHQIKVELDTEIKKLIIDGDLEMIVEVLKDIQSKFVKEVSSKIDNQKKTFDIETLNSAKPISSCETVLEFVIVALSQNLILKPKQSQQLLNNNFKLLTHVFIKGVKGQYIQLVTLLQETYNNMPRLIELLRDEEHQIGFFVSFLKLSIFSKDSEVVHWGLRLLGKLAYDLAQFDLLFHMFQWFWIIQSDYNTLKITLNWLNHLQLPYLKLQIMIIVKYLDNRSILRIKYSYIEFYGALIPYLNCDLINYNYEQQIQIAIRLSDNQSTRDEKNVAIQFLCNAWIHYNAFLEQNMQYQQSILAMLQRTAKDSSTILKTYSITQAFKLLDGLAQKKVITAVSVYKKLISILIESQNNEYIVRQFSYIIQKYPSIPIELLIDGLIKNQHLNISDCDIYYVLSAHQNLKVQSAITMLELLIRIYNSSVLFQSALFPTIQQIIQKFIELSEFQEYMNRMSQTCLNLYVNSVRSKKTTTTLTNYQDDSVVNSQRRAQTIQLFKYIIQLRCFQMNNMLKPLFVGAHLELRSIENRDNKGILQLLQMLGDPNTIVDEYVTKDQQMTSQLFLEKKMQQMEGSQSQALEDQYLQKNKKLFEKEEDLVKSLLLEEKNESKNLQQTKKKKRNYDFDEFQCVYEEGELAYKPQDVVLIDFSFEEDVDRESMNIAIKHFSKTFRYLFNKYASTPQEAAKNRLRSLDQSQLELRSSDIVKILQDYEIFNFSTYEEIINLVATVNHKFNLFSLSSQIRQLPQDNQTEKQSSISATTSRTVNYKLDFENFKKFLIQFAVLIFGRPPKDFRKMPSGHVLVEFFKYFSFVARRRNDNHLIFDDPDGVTTVADKSTIQKWNAQLLQNPNIEVPTETRLKKVQIERVSLHYQMRDVMKNLNKSYLTCFEIVNELIQSKFKTNIVEPTFKINLIYEVKPIAAKGVHSEFKVDPLAEKQEQLKNSLSLLPIEKQEFMNRSLDLSQLSEEKIINKSIVEKIVSMQEEALKKELKDLKWQKRKDYLDKQQDRIQQFKEKKEEIRFNESQVVGEQLRDQKPRHINYMNNLKKEYRKNQSEVVIKSSLPQQDERKDSPKKKGQQPQQDNKQKQQPLPAEKKPAKEDKAEQRFKARTAEMAAHYKTSLEKKERLNEKFQNFYKDPKVQAEFKHFRSSGSVAFNHYLKYSDAWNYSGKKIVLQGWLDFANAFNLMQVFSEEQLIKVFTNTLKQKNYVAHREAVQKNLKYQDEIGLTYFEFEYVLLKIAIMGQEYFNAIQSGKKLDDNLKQLIIYKEKQSKKPKIKHKYVEMLEDNMNKTTSFTLAACLAYLDIPQNKDLFAGKLRSIEGDDIIEETKPKHQSVDMQSLKKRQGLPESPQVKKNSKWSEPGTHGKPGQEKKSMTDSQLKLPYLPKDAKSKELLEITKKWEEERKKK